MIYWINVPYYEDSRFSALFQANESSMSTIFQRLIRHSDRFLFVPDLKVPNDVSAQEVLASIRQTTWEEELFLTWAGGSWVGADVVTWLNSQLDELDKETHQDDFD